MSDRERIQHTVDRLRLTRRAQVVLDYFVRGLFWGAIPAALMILASRIWIIPIPNSYEYYIAAGLLALTVVCCTLVAFFVKLTPLEVANDIDVTLGLRERVSSALALGEDKKTAKDPFVKTLVKDAAKSVDGLPLKRVYPWRIPPALKLALPALLIAGAMVFVPQLNLFANEEDRNEIQIVNETGDKLIKMAEEIERKNEEQKPFINEQAKEIKRVGEKLSNNNMKKKEALKELQRLKEKLETQAQAQIPDGEKKFLSELGEQLTKFESTRELGEQMKDGDFKAMLSQMNELAKDMAMGKLSAEQQEMLEDIADALDEALKSEAAQDPQAQEMKKNLEDLKEMINQDKQMREQMEKMLNELEKDVSKLGKEMSQEGMQQQGQQLQQQMQKMQQQMQQDGNVSQQSMEQMKQMLEQAQEMIDKNTSLDNQTQQQLQESVKEALDNFKPKEGGG